MDFIYETDRIYLEGADNSVIAEISFPEASPGVVNICHTEVDRSLQGQGVAGQITKAAADYLRKENKKAVLTCSYAVKWFEAHPEYRDVLAD